MADHTLPSQRAMLFAALPPAEVKVPPTYTVLPLTAIAFTLPFTPLAAPLPTVDQLLPFQRAMRFASVPPISVKEPPAYTSLPLTAIA
jgi:hypothetical protein